MWRAGDESENGERSRLPMSEDPTRPDETDQPVQRDERDERDQRDRRDRRDERDQRHERDQRDQRHERDQRAAMVKELQQLRRGHGIHAPDVMQRVGPLLGRVCRLDQAGLPGDNRDRLVRRIATAVLELPTDLRLAVQAALGLPPATQSRFLRERMLWLGVQLDRDPRTAMRRVESGLTLLAERLLSQPGDSPAPQNVYAPEGWYVDLLRATFMMHVDPVQLLETRRITSTTDGLEQLTVSWSVPADDPSRPSHVGVDMLYGGELVRDDEASTPAYWSGVVRLPHPLAAGERHEYQVRVTSLPRALLRPYYVLTPFRRFDEFELRAKFDPANPPELVWGLDGVPFQLVDENQPVGDLRQPDAVGEVSHQWRHLRQGLSYGLRWRFPRPAAPLDDADVAPAG
jgi:hypothetical protein